MNYIKVYNEITTTAQNKKRARDSERYYENHHIVPRCLDGTDDESNLVLLTAREHYIVHWLLTKIHPDNLKLAYAFHMMSVESPTATERRVRSKAYDAAKNALNSYVKRNGPIYIHHDNRLTNFVWLTKDGKNERINCNSPKLDKLLQSGWNRGRAKFSRMSPTVETRAKMSKTRKGRPGNNTGKTLSTKGKTYEELHGVEEAQRLKFLRSKQGKQNKKKVEVNQTEPILSI